jgi:hypothetical protein
MVMSAAGQNGTPGSEITGEFVAYEDFGAVGDGVADDLPAICQAHDYANKHGRRVRTKPEAIYHLGRRALTAVIATDTDWGSSRFIIDDSAEVEDHRKALFDVRSLLPPTVLKIDRLTRDQDRLEVLPPVDSLVHVQNRKRRIFIRRGLNQNNGTVQQEVFILRRDGSIEGAIDWDYDTVSAATARPIDPVTLFLRGGVFTHVGNRMRQEKGYNYWSRNIRIGRSNTVVDGLTHRVTGETDVGHPYGGFLNISNCADITLRNCRIDPRKTYKTIGAAGKPVSMGSYGYSASLVVNFRMINCRMESINDRSRWGVIGSNFMKNILLEECVLSRMDVHQGVSGEYIIRRCTLGYAGLNAIGRGRLIVEDSTLHGSSLISFRSDYGSTWEGDVLIRNCRWIPGAGSISRTPVMFGMHNDGTHDFGYPCFMPQEIRIDGLFIDDAKHPQNYQGVAFFGDPIGRSAQEPPFPYALTRTLRVRDLKSASGMPPRVSTNPELEKAITLIAE